MATTRWILASQRHAYDYWTDLPPESSSLYASGLDVKWRRFEGVFERQIQGDYLDIVPSQLFIYNFNVSTNNLSEARAEISSPLLGVLQVDASSGDPPDPDNLRIEMQDRTFVYNTASANSVTCVESFRVFLPYNEYYDYENIEWVISGEAV